MYKYLANSDEDVHNIIESTAQMQSFVPSS